MVSSKAQNRYPRPGQRVAPYTLREFLLEPIPDEFKEKLGVADLKLCDLDETIWKRFPAETIVELSQIVVDRISTYHVRKVFQRRHFPRPAEGTDLSALRLENRTRRCLVREGFDECPQALGDHTIGEIMSMRAFGPRCLVDLLSALESPRGDDGDSGDSGGGNAGRGVGSRPALSEELTAVAAGLADLPGAELVHSDDPRFANCMHAVDTEARTAGIGQAALGSDAGPARSRLRGPPGAAPFRADRADAPADAGGRVDRGFRLDSAQPQRGDPHRLLRLERRASTHVDAHRQAIWDYPGADSPGLRQVDAEGQEHSQHPGPGDGPVLGAGPAAFARGRRGAGGGTAPARLDRGGHVAGGPGDRGQVVGPPHRLPRRADRSPTENQSSPGGPARPGRDGAGHRRPGEEGRSIFMVWRPRGRSSGWWRPSSPAPPVRNWCGRPCS